MNKYDELRQDVERILAAPLFYARREVVMAGEVKTLLDENEVLRAAIHEATGLLIAAQPAIHIPHTWLQAREEWMVRQQVRLGDAS